MDKNKLAKLKEVEYKVHKVCGNCAWYGRTSKGSMDSKLFDICFKHNYHHLKHNDSDRELSTTTFGSCQEHEWIEEFLNRIHDFKQFTEK